MLVAKNKSIPPSYFCSNRGLSGMSKGVSWEPPAVPLPRLRLPRQRPAQSQRSANLQRPQHAEGKIQPDSL